VLQAAEHPIFGHPEVLAKIIQIAGACHSFALVSSTWHDACLQAVEAVSTSINSQAQEQQVVQRLEQLPYIRKLQLDCRAQHMATITGDALGRLRLTSLTLSRLLVVTVAEQHACSSRQVQQPWQRRLRRLTLINCKLQGMTNLQLSNLITLSLQGCSGFQIGTQLEGLLRSAGSLQSVKLTDTQLT